MEKRQQEVEYRMEWEKEEEVSVIKGWRNRICNGEGCRGEIR